MTSSAPLWYASSALYSVDVVPTTRRPRRFSNCVRSWPSPPAAACTSTVSPGWNRYMSLHRKCAVMPCIMTAAATGVGICSGIGTRRLTGATTYSE